MHVKNCKVGKTNDSSKFCSLNKFCSGTPYAPEQEKETLNKLTALCGGETS